MTLNDANKKVTEVVEGIGGKYAIITLLSIIAATSSWMLKTEVEQGIQQTILVERLVNFQSQTTERLIKDDTELRDFRASMDRMNQSMQQLEVRMGQLSQRISDLAPSGR